MEGPECLRNLKKQEEALGFRVCSGRSLDPQEEKQGGQGFENPETHSVDEEKLVVLNPSPRVGTDA